MRGGAQRARVGSAPGVPPRLQAPHPGVVGGKSFAERKGELGRVQKPTRRTQRASPPRHPNHPFSDPRVPVAQRRGKGRRTPHLRAEGLFKLEDLLDVLGWLLPGRAALAVLPGHGSRGARGGDPGLVRAGEGAHGWRRLRAEPRGDGCSARGCSAQAPQHHPRLRLRFLPCSFLPLSLSPPGNRAIGLRFGHPDFLPPAASQPHFLLLSGFPSPP